MYCINSETTAVGSLFCKLNSSHYLHLFGNESLEHPNHGLIDFIVTKYKHPFLQLDPELTSYSSTRASSLAHAALLIFQHYLRRLKTDLKFLLPPLNSRYVSHEFKLSY
jgi:hypothetical protein